MKNSVLVLVLIFSLTFISAQESSFGSKDLSDIAKLNLISVTIGGDFIVNGTFQSSRTERIDQFVTRIFNESKIVTLQSVRDEKSFAKVQKDINSFATRGILLKRKDGSELQVDLEKFRLTADFSLNPYLKEGDVIIFPVYDQVKNFIEIRGAVNKPGKYPFVKGDKLSDIMLLARGIPTVYDSVETVEISRLDFEGTNEEIIKVTSEDDIELLAGDRINIITNKIVNKDQKVLVLGEVNRPGYIYITKNNTKLADVISRAGGFKNEAALHMAELIRNSNSINLLRKESIENQIRENDNYDFDINSYEKLEMLLSGRMANITHEDTSFYNLDNKLRMLQARRNIDFTNLEDERNNVTVKNGDIILVPEKTNLVFLYGQVASAGYYQYDPNKSVLDYIEEAGGLGEDAQDEDEIVVIKSKTYEWKTLEENEHIKLEPGDYVWVPKAPPRTIEYYVKSVGTVLSALGTLALIVIQIWVK